MILSAKEKQTLAQVARQLIYFFLTICFALFLWYLAYYYRGETFTEFGIVENIQLVILLASGWIFVAEAFFLQKDSAILLLLASLCFLGACREVDSFFDAYLPVISWKFGYFFPIIAVINLWRQGEKAIKSLFYFFETPAFNLMCAALLIVVSLAQVLGHRSFIATVLGSEADARAVRRIIEEGAEIIGYFLIFLSTIECYFNLRSKK